MPDDFYQWLLFVLPIVLGAVLGLWTKRFERPGYRWAVVIFCVLFSAGAYVEMRHESRKAASDRDKAIKDTAKQYADTVASQALKIGELEEYIQSQGKDVRDVKKHTVASTAEVHALFEQNQTAKQKRQDAKDKLHGYIGMNNSVLGTCHAVGAPNRGGTNAQVCVDDAKARVWGATGYISGSLGELYVNRFIQAGLRRNNETAVLNGIDSSLDPYTAREVYWAMHESEAKADVLKEFIKELQ